MISINQLRISINRVWLSFISLAFLGADLGFLEGGFLCIKVWWFALLIYLIYENEIIWSH